MCTHTKYQLYSNKNLKKCAQDWTGFPQRYPSGQQVAQYY